MSTTLSRFSLVALTAIVFAASSGLSVAYPTRGGSCSLCHTRAGGALTATPNPLNIQLAASGLLTFTITGMGGADAAAISVQGLENPLLGASIGRGSGTWTFRSNSSYGQSYVSNTISRTGTYLLNLAINAGASVGSYPITVMFANGEMGCTTTRFSLVIRSTVPEPTGLVLLISTVAAIPFRRRRRELVA